MCLHDTWEQHIYYNLFLVYREEDEEEYYKHMQLEHRILNMIYSLQRTNIETIKNNLALQFIPILLDMVVLNHNNNHIEILQELVKVIILVFSNLVSFEERIIALERSSKMTLLSL